MGKCKMTCQCKCGSDKTEDSRRETSSKSEKAYRYDHGYPGGYDEYPENDVLRDHEGNGWEPSDHS